MITKDMVLVPSLAVAIWSPTTASLPSLVHDNLCLFHALGETHEGTALNFFNPDDINYDNMVQWDMLRTCIEWQPWPHRSHWGVVVLFVQCCHSLLMSLLLEGVTVC
jgi:hypothetical protein